MATFLLIVLATFLYLLPGVAASRRHHPDKTSIWILTIALGWTIVGWVAAMVWAFWPAKRKPVEQHS